MKDIKITHTTRVGKKRNNVPVIILETDNFKVELDNTVFNKQRVEFAKNKILKFNYSEEDIVYYMYEMLWCNGIPLEELHEKLINNINTKRHLDLNPYQAIIKCRNK